MKKKVSIVVILIVVICLGVASILISNDAPTFMTFRPTYEQGSDISAFELVTESVVDLTDDRTDVEDLDIVLTKNNIVVEDLNADYIDTSNPDNNQYIIKVTDNGGKSISETLYYEIAN